MSFLSHFVPSLASMEGQKHTSAPPQYANSNRPSPLCIEEFDLSDRNFRPCPCGYQVRTSTLCPC